MAQTESQLEIYKIILGRKTVREIIKEKEHVRNRNIEDNTLFSLLFSKMLHTLTRNTAWRSDRTKIGLSLFSNNGEDVNRILTCHSEQNIIEGFVDGGPYDKIRTAAQMNNVSDKMILGRDKMIASRFYLYMHLPLDSTVGLLFLERKTGQSIKNAIEFFLKELLRTNRQIKLERFVPQSLIDEYKDAGIVDSFTFTDFITTGVMDGNGIDEIVRGYDVSIKIMPTRENRPSYDLIRNALGFIGQGNFNIGNTTKSLSNFSKKKGTLKKDNKEYSFVIGDDLKIKPMIPINDEMQDEQTGMLKRADIKSMCDDLLAQIHEEVYIVG